MAASHASCEALWLRKLMVDLFDMELSSTVIQCDNQSCIKLSENPVFHDKSKHIEISDTSSGTMFREELFDCSMFQQMSRWLTFSRRLWVEGSMSTSEIS